MASAPQLTAASALALAAGAYLAYRAWSAYRHLSDERHSVLLDPARVRAASAGHTHPEGSVFHAAYVENAQGLWLYVRRWRAARPRGYVFLSHGLGEYSGRYEHVAERLVARGFTVFAVDHQGHGLSEGDRCHVARFAHFVDDFLRFKAHVRATEPGFDDRLPRFLLGHSLGGLIAALAAQREPDWRGVVLSGPAVHVNPALAPDWLIRVGRVVSRLLPKAAIGECIPPEQISNDPRVVYQYYRDPLVNHSRMRARLGLESLDAVREAAAGAPKMQVPLLLVQASRDSICLPEGARAFFALVGSADKTYYEAAGFQHEIFADPGGMDVLDDAIAWIEGRL